MAAAIPTTNEFRPGNWACPSCGNHNFASKTACNNCQLPKEGLDGLPMPSDGGGGRGGGGGGGGGDVRPGDWTCPSCNNHNYANKTACNRCSLPKMDFGGAAEAFGGGAEAALGGYGKMMGGQGSGAARGTPYGQSRPGDWACVQCGNHNYASRTACNKCQMPPEHMSNGYSMTAAPMLPSDYTAEMLSRSILNELAGGKGGMAGPHDDWICYACNDSNYGSMDSCKTCQMPKTTFVAKSGMRVGDWLCTACNNHNYRDKQVCNKCGGPKEGSTVYQGNLREGDWICPGCSNHNYADKIRCNSCQAPKMC